jgi:uncharacterized protein (DUF305 family)
MGTSINSEYEYLVHMIPHHEEAVATAKILKENTNREAMRDFADNIIKTQTEEIEQMNAWLDEWYPDRSHTTNYEPMMRELSHLEGEELDEAFLEDMIFHHMEAVMTSQQLLTQGLAEHPEVADLARNIRDAQRREIQMMNNWLAQWNGTSSSFGPGNPKLMTGVGFTALGVLLGLTIWLISESKSSQSTAQKSAAELLDTRYAKGKISREEYLEAKKNITS